MTLLHLLLNVYQLVILIANLSATSLTSVVFSEMLVRAGCMAFSAAA